MSKRAGERNRHGVFISAQEGASSADAASQSVSRASQQWKIVFLRRSKKVTTLQTNKAILTKDKKHFFFYKEQNFKYYSKCHGKPNTGGKGRDWWEQRPLGPYACRDCSGGSSALATHGQGPAGKG